MKIAVYCGSTPGSDPLYKENAYELGRWMGRNGHELVYGGSSTGLMGATADGVLAEGGRVTGVIPNVTLIIGRRHPGLTQVIQTETMAERKTVMLEMADAFIALPGGIGTLDEITEVISLKSLGIVHGTIIFYNMNGYYESMRAVLDNILAHGFDKADYFQDIVFAEDLSQIKKALS
ncbi:MAG: TIGR00730 family Rossman fold protein [Firmicutes bacterium]|nr:TIGR00730 family Rossman fold protein [Bacillota bacterium]